MDVYATEEEQLAKVKSWLKEYGPTIIISVLIVIGGTFGWRYWQGHQEKIRLQASVGYEQMMTNLVKNDNKKTTLQAEYLIKEFPNTGYAQIAGLVLARIAVEGNKLEQADKHLQWVIDNSKTSSTIQIAKIRKARVLLAQNKPKKALALLQKVDDKAYTAAIEMTKGDIYLRIKQKEKAKQAYNSALNALSKIDISRPILQMKLDNLSAANGINKQQSTQKTNS